MLKKIVRDMGAQKALAMLTKSSMGRGILRKGVCMIGNKLNIPITVDTNAQSDSKMIFSFGEPDANLHFRCTIHTETLAEIIELFTTAWANDTKLSKEDLLPILQKATRFLPVN